jgi:hypothetical protein
MREIPGMRGGNEQNSRAPTEICLATRSKKVQTASPDFSLTEIKFRRVLARRIGDLGRRPYARVSKSVRFELGSSNIELRAKACNVARPKGVVAMSESSPISADRARFGETAMRVREFPSAVSERLAPEPSTRVGFIINCRRLIPSG